MNLFVVDASVAAKWFLPALEEPLSQEALELFRRYSDGRVRFIVPDLFWAEFANILWKAVRQGRLQKKDGQAAIAEMTRLALTTVSSASLIEDAYEIATDFGRTVYDGVYVALAVLSRAQLVTADRKLANALAAEFPVKWLASI